MSQAEIRSICLQAAAKVTPQGSDYQTLMDTANKMVAWVSGN